MKVDSNYFFSVLWRKIWRLRKVGTGLLRVKLQIRKARDLCRNLEFLPSWRFDRMHLLYVDKVVRWDLCVIEAIEKIEIRLKREVNPNFEIGASIESESKVIKGRFVISFCIKLETQRLYFERAEIQTLSFWTSLGQMKSLNRMCKFPSVWWLTINLVFTTQSGLVQIVLAAPAVIALKIWFKKSSSPSEFKSLANIPLQLS